MTITYHDFISSVRFVLVRPSHPGNIGGAARAMRTMGFIHLALVAPQRFPDPQANVLAAGADMLLNDAAVEGELVDALSGVTFALGLSARRRAVRLPELTPREAAIQALSVVSRGERVALLFGNERSGLENEELARCHVMVRIPSVDDFSSLNLAQAVQIMAYELRLAMLGDNAAPLARDRPLVDVVQMEHFYEHLGKTLDDIDFHKGRSPETMMLRLRKLFQRIALDERELRILHGILADARRMAKLAKKPGSQKTGSQ